MRPASALDRSARNSRTTGDGRADRPCGSRRRLRTGRLAHGGTRRTDSVSATWASSFSVRL
ncbi:hypothetical protein, partial [Nocardia farcinica]|uniref:hypothetical protein n=1 Tax=Nocardia farcinica TaxID=37329 RepID=UPI0024564972